MSDKKVNRAYLFSIVLVAVLGGLLFGYDTAVISGAEKGLQAFFMGASDFQYTDFMHGITSSAALLGCIIGSALSGLLASGLGRKKTLFVAGILFFLSALGSYMPEFLFFEKGVPTFGLLIAFNLYRVLGGLGVGIASALCPMYIAEISPARMRGTLVSWNQFAIIFGQLVVYFVNLVILGKHIAPVIESVASGINQITNGALLAADANWSITTGWRLMFVSECVPAGLFTLLVLLIPETPRYLAMTGRDSKALEVLTRINGEEAAKGILADIKATAHTKTEKLFTFGVKVVVIGILLSVFQQAIGINAVLYYAPRIFESLGMGNPMLQTVLMGIVNIRRSQHHGLQRLLHVQLGPYLLGAHIRDLPEHHPQPGDCHRGGFPVDIQLHRFVHLRAHVQHEPRFHLRPLLCHVRNRGSVRMEVRPRDQGQDPGGDERAVEAEIGYLRFP